MLRVYGIKNCDTVRKTLKWLEQRSVPHEFHDFRVDGLDEKALRGWLESPLGDELLNRRSATWRVDHGALRYQTETSPGPPRPSPRLGSDRPCRAPAEEKG